MARLQPGSARDLAELILGFGVILVVLWTPESAQRILSPIARTGATLSDFRYYDRCGKNQFAQAGLQIAPLQMKGYLGQSLNAILVLAEQTGHFLV
jgi:hypothetical protein